MLDISPLWIGTFCRPGRDYYRRAHRQYGFFGRPFYKEAMDRCVVNSPATFSEEDALLILISNFYQLKFPVILCPGANPDLVAPFSST